MKGAAIGMTLILVICGIAVLDKYANQIPGANAVGVKSDFVEPGLWLEPDRITIPPKPQTTTSPPSKATVSRPRKAPKNKVASAEYPKQIPY